MLSSGGVRRMGSTCAGAVQVRRSLWWERADAAAEEAAQCCMLAGVRPALLPASRALLSSGDSADSGGL